jgi:hypothetical protein
MTGPVVLERTGYRGALALRCLDMGTGAEVADGLSALAWPVDQPQAARSATLSPISSLLGFGRLPGLDRLQRTRTTGDGPLVWPTAPPPAPFVVRVQDRSARYLPVVLTVSCPVTEPVEVPLFNAPARKAPSGWASVRGEVHLAGGPPAAWAIVEIDTGTGGAMACTDARGRFVSVLPYPDALPPLSGTPASGAGIDHLTWGLTVGVRFDAAAQVRGSGTTDADPPTLASIDAQPAVPVAAAGGPAPTLDVELVHGVALVLQITVVP